MQTRRVRASFAFQPRPKSVEIPTAKVARLWLNEVDRYVMTVSGVGLLSRSLSVLARVVLVALTALGVSVGAPSANAQQTLRVDVPGECGSRDTFLEDVTALQRTTTAQLTVSEVTIVRRDARTYELRLVSAEGSRVVVDADCRTLLKTAAVIAATLAEAAPATPSIAAEPDDSAGAVGATPSSPDAVASSPVVEPAPVSPSTEAIITPEAPAAAPLAPTPPTSPATKPSSPAPTEPPSSDTSSDTSTALQLGAGAAGFAGLSPEPHLGVEVLAGLVGNRWGGHLAARLLPPRSMLVRDDLGVRQVVWGARVSASRLAAPWLRISLGLSGYWISAQGLGVSEPSTDGVGLLAPELEVVASVLAQPAIRAEIGLQGRVGLTQPRFEVESGELVYELPRWGGAAVLRILWTQR